MLAPFFFPFFQHTNMHYILKNGLPSEGFARFSIPPTPLGTRTLECFSPQAPSELGEDTIDVFHREKYLSKHEFREVFGMKKKEFHAIPEWKQLEIKKKVGLF